jgi:hypothetical protein
MKYKMLEHSVFDERPQETCKVVEQDLKVKEEENIERQTTGKETTSKGWKSNSVFVTTEMVMLTTTEEKKLSASQREKKSVETKLKEGMEPYVHNIGGST